MPLTPTFPAAKDGSNVDPGEFKDAININSVSVFDYGAVGDGVADDTIAIQAAMDSGRAVFFPVPSDHYKITASLVINRNGLQMFADGHGAVIIRQATAGASGIVNGGNYSYSNIIGLWIDGPGSATSTGIGVNLSGTSTFTMRHSMTRCIITDFQTGLKTGDTVLFVGHQIQCGSNITDIDLSETDTVKIDTFGTGTSFGNGAVGNLGVKAYNNHSVLLMNADAGNCERWLSVNSGRVKLIGANLENIKGDGAIFVAPTGRLEIVGYIQHVGTPTTANSAFILLDGDSGAAVPELICGNVGLMSAGWRAIVSRGGLRHSVSVMYTGAHGPFTTLVYYQSTAGGAVDTTRLLGSLPMWHHTKWTTSVTNSDANNLARLGNEFYLASRDDVSAVDEAAGKFLKNRFGTVSRVDFNSDNHQRIIVNSSAVVGNIGTGEDALFSHSLLGNTLLKVGETVTLISYGTTAANANTKTFRVKFGANALFDSGSLAINNIPWELETVIARYGTTNWVARTRFTHGATVVTQIFEGTASLDTAQILTITGEATADNDIRALFAQAIWRKGSINI